MVLAWGLLGNGVHHLRTFVDDVMIANAEFEVVAIGNGFVTGLERTQRLNGFPTSNESVIVRWSEPDQNFLIIEYDDGIP